MRTFSIQTLGCKVNQYESEQIASLLRSRGLVEVASPGGDVRVVNTCSVTVQAASKSRQTIRRTAGRTVSLPMLRGASPSDTSPKSRSRTIATGCWATSDRSQAAALVGVDAVITHHDDVAAELDRLLTIWENRPTAHSSSNTFANANTTPQKAASDVVPGCGAESDGPRSGADEGWMKKAGTLAADLVATNKPRDGGVVNGKVAGPSVILSEAKDLGLANSVRVPEILRFAQDDKRRKGTTSLPLLGERQTGHQRAFLKVQDGCDAHCTYCIIPKLRPRVWSKTVDDAVGEATRLVASGHVELVLTGIFLGAYGQPTALRRRQDQARRAPIAALIDGLCTRVPGLRRLRLSSLEPGDLTPDLIAVLKSHAQVVPHFHLPLQSGSDFILRRMNRQYTRDDFLRMVEQVYAAFDRPALTTDVIAGFPGETDAEFERTIEVVDAARFIHVHAFSFSPRPGTAAARWSSDFVRGPVVNDRIDALRARAELHSFEFRKAFVGEEVELLVERASDEDEVSGRVRHGRCERYFSVFFESDRVIRDGETVRVRVDRVTLHRTMGVVVGD